MKVFLAGKKDIVQCFQKGNKYSAGGGGECIMYYEVYCNRIKHRCKKHNPRSQGIYNLVSRLEGNFKMVHNCHELLKGLEELKGK